MFLTSPVHLPLPHGVDPGDADIDAEARLLRLTHAIADIGRRNDEMRRAIADNGTLVECLIADGDRRER